VIEHGVHWERMMKLVERIQTQTDLARTKIEQESDSPYPQWLEQYGPKLIYVTKVGFDFTLPIPGWYRTRPVVIPHSEEAIQSYPKGTIWVESRDTMVLECMVLS
jgi:hypothetical protein